MQRQICGKVTRKPIQHGRSFKFFIFDDPKPEDVRPFARSFVSSDYEIKPVLEAMFRSPVFYSNRTIWAKIKTIWAKIKRPVEFVVDAIRATAVQVPMHFAPNALKGMSQELFNPPNVKGWEGGAWINTSTLMTRLNFAMQLARLNEEKPPLFQAIRDRVAQ